MRMKGFGHENYIKPTENDVVETVNDAIKEAEQGAIEVDSDAVVEGHLDELDKRLEDASVEEEVEAVIEETVEEAVNEVVDGLDKVVDDVLKGLFGSGAKRERLLREKGFDPEVVQKAINERIK